MENTPPLVTVILPVYNRPHVIYTIESILQQTYKNIDLLIIDNASTDNTVEVIRGIKDSRIRLIVNESNRGQTFSINRGLKLARGTYIARIDSDDFALPSRIEKQVSFMESHPDYGLVGCWVHYMNDADKLTVLMKMPVTDKGLRFMQEFACGVYHSAAMMRKSILDEFHIRYNPDIAMAEDYDMWKQIMQHSKAQNLGEVLLYYRRGGSNDSKKYKDTMLSESYTVREDVCKLQISDPLALRQALDCIKLEKDKYIPIFTAVRIWHYYMQRLNREIGKFSPDYKIIKLHLVMKFYSSCISENKAFYARFLNCIYRFTLNMRYKIGTERSMV